MEPACGKGRPSVQLVYVNSFGSHRCGIIRYGRGCRGAEAGPAGARLRQLSPAGEAGRQRPAPAPGDAVSPGPATAGSRAQEVRSCAIVRPASRHRGDLQKAKADTFDFPFPSRNVNKVIKRKKKKSKVWLKVWKVISKMLEENEKFRSRLLTCSQRNGEGSDMNQSS